jgi:hypothetical protein
MRHIVLPIVCAVFGIALLVCLQNCNRYENFGTSPATMVQLQTSHVPTEEDAHFYQNVYPKMVRKEVTSMTDGDPGELRPWIFPWYGRGVTLIAS